MGLLIGVLHPVNTIMTWVMRLCRSISVVALALMVLIILIQVFFRYVLNSALPWPDEAARFLMLWMTGLMAPAAYRTGGFVAIDLVGRLLPRPTDMLLTILLFGLSCIVLIVAVQFGLKHTNSGWLFASSSLRVPLDLIGMKSFKIKLAWMYMSLLVGCILLLVVNVELILRSIVALLGRGDDLPVITHATAAGAE